MEDALAHELERGPGNADGDEFPDDDDVEEEFSSTSSFFDSLLLSGRS